MDKNIIEKIVSAISSFPHRTGVISTVSEDNKPSSSTVYYAFDQNLNIYFATRVSTKKYKNYLTNPNVAFLTSIEKPTRTIQIEGTISIVEDVDEQKKYFSEIIDYISTNFSSAPFGQMMNSDLAIMKITPTWARFGDFDPERKTESPFIETSAA